MNNHKFIEFYDVRAAEAALRALNKIDISGKQIKLEPGHPRFETWWLDPFFFPLFINLIFSLICSSSCNCFLYFTCAYLKDIMQMVLFWMCLSICITFNCCLFLLAFMVNGM